MGPVSVNTVTRQVGIQNIRGTHNMHSHAKDVEQSHKNAYGATGFQKHRIMHRAGCYCLSEFFLVSES